MVLGPWLIFNLDRTHIDGVYFFPHDIVYCKGRYDGCADTTSWEFDNWYVCEAFANAPLACAFNAPGCSCVVVSVLQVIVLKIFSAHMILFIFFLAVALFHLRFVG